jgi:hypothetical protein
MVKEYRSTLNKARGKFNHLTVDDLVRLGLGEYTQVKEQDINFDSLLVKVRDALVEEGFVFFEDTLDYKYLLDRKKELQEFMIQFHHIK